MPAVFSVTSAELTVWLTTFFYPFVRMLALMSTAPVFSEKSVPRQVKVGIAAILAVVLAPAIGPVPSVPIVSPGGIWIIVQQVLIGGAIWLAARRHWKPAAGIAVALFALMLPRALQTAEPASTSKPIRIVQPNIGQESKWREGYDALATQRLKALSGAPSAEPRLLLWPEAAVTAPLQDSRPAAAASTSAERQRAAAHPVGD